MLLKKFITHNFIALGVVSSLLYINNSFGSLEKNDSINNNRVIKVSLQPIPDKNIRPMPDDGSFVFSERWYDNRDDLSVNEIIYIDDKFIRPPSGKVRRLEPYTVEQNYKPRNFNKQLSCFVEALYFEARGVNYENVANVILNRVLNKRFPNSICGVVHQSGQFSYYFDENINLKDFSEKRIHKKIEKFAKNMLKSKYRVDTTSGALFYYNPEKVVGRKYWADISTFTVYDGAHLFMLDDYKKHEIKSKKQKRG